MAEAATLLVGGVDVAALSDDELYLQLSALNAVVGPVTGTTRSTYQRKLAVLLGASMPDCSFTAGSHAAAAGQQEVQEEADAAPTQAYYEHKKAVEENRGVSLRQRRSYTAGTSTLDSYNEDDADWTGGDDLHPSMYTPSPRPPLRSTTTTPTDSRHYESYSSYSSPLRSPATPTTASRPTTTRAEATGKTSMSMKILFALIALIVAAIFFYYRSLNVKSNVFDSLEYIAKSAADTLDAEQQQPSH